MKTVDAMTTLRCLLVGLSDAQAGLCARTLAPITMVRLADPRQACAAMSSVLPLIVVASTALGEEKLAELDDFATACVTELIVLDDPPRRDAADRLLQAVRAADTRRMRPGARED